MLELESRFEVQGKKMLVVGWFEGSGTGRLVVVGPNGEREEVPIASVDVSLAPEVTSALAQPPPKLRGGAVVVAHHTMVADGVRATRSMELTGRGTRLDDLCVKLLGMAQAAVQHDTLKAVVSKLYARCR